VTAMAAMNEIAINPDEKGLLLWKMFDDTLDLFWKGYFKYFEKASIEVAGTEF
jgi:hypothetical protein